jgi:hypothetical protein
MEPLAVSLNNTLNVIPEPRSVIWKYTYKSITCCHTWQGLRISDNRIPVIYSGSDLHS